MVFSSLTFLLLFLPVTLLFYYLLPRKAGNVVLLLMSLVFYAWGEPVYVLLMMYSILFNYLMGREIERVPGRKKWTLAFTVVVNVLLLGFFKYYGFVVNNLNSLLHLSIPVRDLPLPIGISFYTFQAMSYVIDLYRGKVKAQRNIIKFACYITMFPQLIAGPIVRYADIEAQLSDRSVTLAKLGKGALRFVAGLAKKVLIANLAGNLFESIHAEASLSVLSSWLGTFAYTFQIYFDFSGYSDMAIGLGQMLGFDFPENFNYPYIATSVTDFWRRWHISLGTWFREYVYIPLGGNRVKVVRHLFNILVVWLLTGLWHGAGWNFLLWGLYYAVLLILDKYLFSKIKIWKGIRIFFTLILVMLGWVLFYSESIPEIVRVVQAMFGFGNGLYDTAGMHYLLTGGPLLLIAAFGSTPLLKMLSQRTKGSLAGRIAVYVLAVAVFALSVLFLVTENYNPFLYFRF